MSAIDFLATVASYILIGGGVIFLAWIAVIIIALWAWMKGGSH